MARRQAPRRPQLAAVATVVTALLALAACGAAGEEDDVAWMLQLRRQVLQRCLATLPPPPNRCHTGGAVGGRRQARPTPTPPLAAGACTRCPS